MKLIESVLYVLLITATSYETLAFVDCEGKTSAELFPHPDDCTKFIVCIGGIPTEGPCIPGDIFDPEEGNCIHGECEDDVEVEPTVPEIPTTTSEKPTTVDPDIEDGIECPINQHDGEISFVPSRVDCAHYYLCINSRPRRMECREGLHWNQEKMVCDFIENVDCFIGNSLPELDKEGLPICDNNQDMFLPHPQNCKLYISCFYGFRTIQECPFHHNWDFVQEQCIIEHLARCGVTAP